MAGALTRLVVELEQNNNPMDKWRNIRLYDLLIKGQYSLCHWCRSQWFLFRQRALAANRLYRTVLLIIPRLIRSRVDLVVRQSSPPQSPLSWAFIMANWSSFFRVKQFIASCWRSTGLCRRFYLISRWVFGQSRWSVCPGGDADGIFECSGCRCLDLCVLWWQTRTTIAMIS